MSLTQQNEGPKISILIVNWNTGKLLKQCLESIQRINDASRLAEVVVVDNASVDDSMEQASAAASNPRIKLVPLKTNLGFAGGNNRAAKELTDTKSHVLLLNPDTEIHDSTLSRLLDALEDSDVGIVGARLQNPDGSPQASVRKFPTVLNFLFLFLKLHRFFPSTSSWNGYMMTGFDYQKQQRVDQVMGAAFLVRREVWDTLSALDDTFFVWFEEVDFCKRALKAGWTTMYTPHATVTHYGGVSFNQLVGLQRTRPWIKSSLHYIRKHLPTAWPLFFILTPIALGLALPAAWFHRIDRARNATRL